MTGAPTPAPAGDGGALPGTRRVALLSLGVTVVVAVLAWRWLGGATSSGMERLARIDVVRARCDSLWGAARTPADTLAVDRVALADTIDPRSSTPLARCGDLRGVPRGGGAPGALPNPREMTGEPMPRGLR